MGQIMRYILDLTRPHDNLLATEGSQNQSFVWGNELLSASGNESFHYLTDHLGSPIRLMGENESDALAYDEFGVPLIGANNIHQPFGFTGYQTDEVSGLYYAQTRYFSAENARFVSEDYVRDGVNWYVHCYNNPLIFVDLDGLRPSTYQDKDGNYRFYADNKVNNAMVTATGFVPIPFFDKGVQMGIDKASNLRTIKSNEVSDIVTSTLSASTSSVSMLSYLKHFKYSSEALNALKAIGRAFGVVGQAITAVELARILADNSPEINQITQQMFGSSMTSNSHEGVAFKYAIFSSIVAELIKNGAITYDVSMGMVMNLKIDWNIYDKIIKEMGIDINVIASMFRDCPN